MEVLVCASYVTYSHNFFFSSRRRHTRCLSDWSSDVCSSDLVPDHPAANVEEASGVQGTIWIALPSKPSAFTATGQVASKAYIDESLQGPKGLAGIGVTIVVHPPPHYLIHLLHKVLRRDRSAPFREGLYSPAHAALRRFTGKVVDRILSAGWAASLHEVESEEVKTLRQFRDAGL